MINRIVGSIVGATLVVLLVVGCSSSTDGSDTPAGTTTGVSDTGSMSEPGTAGPTSDPAGTSGTTEADPAGSATAGTGTVANSVEATTTSQPAVLTTEVPAPGGGNVNETVAEVPVVTAPSVPLTEPVTQDDITVAITAVAAITAEAIGPGEIGGPAIAVTVQIDNGSGTPLDLSSVSVVLLDSTGSPGITTTGGSAQPLAGELASGGQGQGIYVFTVSESLRQPITVSVSYSTGAPVVLFVGDAT